MGKTVLLEGILFAAVLITSVFFGGVYPWTLMLVCSLFFSAIIFDPNVFLKSLNRSRWLSGLTAILSVVLLVQILFTSVNRYATIEIALQWLACYLAFIFFYSFSRKAVMRFLIFMAGWSVLQCFYGVYQVGSGMEMVLWKAKVVYRGFVTGTYINHNHFAGFLELNLGLMIGFFSFFLDQRKFRPAFLSLAGLLLLFFTLIQTGSRMGLLCFIASICFFLFVALLLRSKKSKYFFLLVLILGCGLWLAHSTVLNRFIDLEDMNASLTGRWLVWNDVCKMISDFPWLGTGLGTFGWVLPHYQSAALMMQWSHAHNDYLELMSEIGIPAALFLIAVIMGFVCRMIKIAMATDFCESWLIRGILIGATSFALHGLADFNFAIPANCLLFFAFLAAANRLSELAKPYYAGRP